MIQDIGKVEGRGGQDVVRPVSVAARYWYYEAAAVPYRIRYHSKKGGGERGGSSKDEEMGMGGEGGNAIVNVM